MPILLLVLMLSAACASAAEQEEVTVSTCGTTARLQKGGTLVVRLPSQVTTGYLWSVAARTGGVVEALGEPQTERQGGDVDGGSEVQVFRFRAVAKGRGALTFHNRRPFEKDKPPRKTCTFGVEVSQR